MTGTDGVTSLFSTSSSSADTDNGGGSISCSWKNSNTNRRRQSLGMPDPVERFRQSGLRVRDRLIVNLLSEFFGTFLLLFVGTGTIMQLVLAEGKLNNYTQVCLAWGVLISLCVFATYRTSGGHLNPAVSLAICSLGKMPWSYFGPYTLAQTLGAFLGAGLCSHVYKDALNKFDGGIRSVDGPTATAAIFCSFPPPHIGHYSAFIDQVVGTALLLFFVCVLIDPRNRVPAYLHPPGFGMAIFLICSSYGMNLGSPINPARDFGPRLFLLFSGYGWEAISWHQYYFWIPLLAPFLGALVGTWLYQFFIGIHVPDEMEEEETSSKKKIAIDEESNPLNSMSP